MSTWLWAHTNLRTYVSRWVSHVSFDIKRFSLIFRGISPGRNAQYELKLIVEQTTRFNVCPPSPLLWHLRWQGKLVRCCTVLNDMWGKPCSETLFTCAWIVLQTHTYVRTFDDTWEYPLLGFIYNTIHLLMQLQCFRVNSRHVSDLMSVSWCRWLYSKTSLRGTLSGQNSA